MIVRLKETNIVDHSVVVCRSRADGVEEEPVKLSRRSLGLCAGSDAAHILVEDLYFIEAQPKSEKKRKKKRDGRGRRRSRVEQC